MKKQVIYPEQPDYDRMLHNANVLTQIKESKSDYRKIVRALIFKGVQDLKSGDIVINGVPDLERLIRFDLELQKEDLML